MRLRVRFIFVPSGQFQSTHRVSDATKTVQDDITAHKFQSTHRVSDATKLLIRRSSISRISIHAPRERCDQVAPFAPFAPVFQSTHRVSDATFALDRFSFVFQFQSTHRVSDATVATQLLLVDLLSISIHAPRERCDPHYCRRGSGHSDFNPPTA